MPVYHFTHQRSEHDHIDVEAPTEMTARLIAREYLIGLYGQKAVDKAPPLKLACWNPDRGNPFAVETRLLSTRLNATQAEHVRIATLIHAAEELESMGMDTAAQELRQMAAGNRDAERHPERKRTITCTCGTRLVFRRHDDAAHDMEAALSTTRCPTCGDPLPGTCPTESEVAAARWTLAEWVGGPDGARPDKIATDAACHVIDRLHSYKLANPNAKVPTCP